jgi:hypothetical protein
MAVSRNKSKSKAPSASKVKRPPVAKAGVSFAPVESQPPESAIEAPAGAAFPTGAPSLAADAAQATLVLPLPPDADSSSRLRAVCVETCRPQGPGRLILHADQPGESYFDPDKRALKLKFQLVALFKTAEVSSLWLEESGEPAYPLTLQTLRNASPVVGKRFSSLGWSASARFAINEVLELGSSNSELVLRARVAEETVSLFVLRF